MTALDQAFIKAYNRGRPGGKSVSTDAATPQPKPAAASDRIEAQTASTAGKLGNATPVKKQSDVLAFVPAPSKKTAKQKATQKSQNKAPKKPATQKADSPKVVYRLDPPCTKIPDAPRAASFTSTPPGGRLSPENNANLQPYDPSGFTSAGPKTQIDVDDSFCSGSEKTRRFDYPAPDAPTTTTSENLPAKGFYPDTAIRVFQAMLQVEHFAWPKVCHRIESIAPVELDRLAETLLAAATKHLKVIGFSGGQRGYGATTMLLCAARRLATRSAKTVIVDADLAKPQLAKRLGLLPQLGWEDVAAGRQPLEEVLIESIADNIAALPLCNPLIVSEISYASQRLMAESLDTLRKNYDLVLMDLGPLEIPQSISDLTANGLNCRIDAVVVVHKIGKVLAICLPAVRQLLTSAGVAIAGVIENFVAHPQNPVPRTISM